MLVDAAWYLRRLPPQALTTFLLTSYVLLTMPSCYCFTIIQQQFTVYSNPHPANHFKNSADKQQALNDLLMENDYQNSNATTEEIADFVNDTDSIIANTPLNQTYHQNNIQSSTIHYELMHKLIHQNNRVEVYANNPQGNVRNVPEQRFRDILERIIQKHLELAQKKITYPYAIDTNYKKSNSTQDNTDVNPANVPAPIDYSKPYMIKCDSRGTCYASPLNDDEVPPLPSYKKALTCPLHPSPITRTN
ncbi:unnamed protein product [Thelazia callipaeda]|uniref:Uncharacterized protein n=1 Tax=Thelazia callipaeda TaxID=103827 RepID=A0A0N5DBK9_THECL|nr:unnamed protein product [Thelazia callipaeda]